MLILNVSINMSKWGTDLLRFYYGYKIIDCNVKTSNQFLFIFCSMYQQQECQRCCSQAEHITLFLHTLGFISGKYAPQGHDDNCLNCPEKYTTEGYGSTSVEDCTGKKFNWKCVSDLRSFWIKGCQGNVGKCVAWSKQVSSLSLIYI